MNKNIVKYNYKYYKRNYTNNRWNYNFFHSTFSFSFVYSQSLVCEAPSSQNIDFIWILFELSLILPLFYKWHSNDKQTIKPTQ